MCLTRLLITSKHLQITYILIKTINYISLYEMFKQIVH